MNTLVSDYQAPIGPELDFHTVELLVTQAGLETVRFPLAEGKSTVGSSPSCQIRLSSESVRPLQCLIVRKGQQFTVTRWAAGVQLNGVDFATSPLNPGDVLSIGELHLELTQPTVLPSEGEIAEPSPVTLIDEVAAQVAAEVAITEVPIALAEPQANSAQADITRLRSAHQHTRQRFRHLVGALRQLRDEAHGLDQQVGALTEQLQAAQQAQERLSAELHQSQAIATERESQIGEELDRAIAELTASYAKADAASQEIESLRSRNQQVQEQIDLLSVELASLRELCNGHEAERLHFEQQLADRESQLTQLRDEIGQLRQSFQASVAELQNQNDSLQEQLAGVQGDREREIAELQQGLEASVTELHEQNETLRRQLGEFCTERDNQFNELHSANDALRSEVTGLAAERDRQIAEFQGVNDYLRNEAAAIAADRDQRIAELDALHASLRNELAAVAEERDRQLSELHNLSESLRQDAAAIAADRDRQIAELNGQYDALQAELVAVTTQRDRELQELRDAMEMSTRELKSEAERLTIQLAERAAERDRAIAELEQAHLAALTESSRQVEALRQQLADAAAEQEQHVVALQSELEQALRVAEEAERLSKLPDPEKIELEGELQAVRSERQKLAEEKHHLTLQLEDAEKRSKLLEIDVRSVNAEWQRTQSTVARLQDELITAQAHAADLDAKLCDFHCSAEVDRAVDSDTFAGDLAAARKEIEEREQALAESLACSEQLRGELQVTEQDLAKCQSNIVELGQQIAKLQAASAATENDCIRLNALSEERASQIDALNLKARESQKALAAELAVRDQRITELDSQLATVHGELVTAENASEAQISALTEQLSKLQTAATDASDERARLIATISDCESRITTLIATAAQIQEVHAAELADRNQRSASLADELEFVREALSEATTRGGARIAELTAALAQWEQKLAGELQTKEELIAEHAAQIATLQNANIAEMTAREAKIAELSTQLEHQQCNVSSELSSRQQACDELRQQLLIKEEQASVELSRRDEQITEITRELHDTQDQLADCAAQGERLAELYRQAQTDLAALAAAPATPMSASVEGTETSEAPGSEIAVVAETPRVEDPRDNDTPRLERALANLPAAAEISELNTETVPFQPSSFIDRYSHIFDEDKDVDVIAPTTAPKAAEPATDLHDFASDDSAALEAYMANMMKRVRGETSSDSIVPPVSRDLETDQSAKFSNPVARMNTLTQRVNVPATVEPNGPEEEKLICLNELKQTSLKPPLPTSLSAMRELANSSARQAIAKHRKRRHFEGALSKLLVSGIAGGTAAYMLFTADHFMSPYFLAGCGVAIVSGYWGFKLCGILLEMIRDGINNERTPVELEDSISPLPIDVVSN